MVLNHEIYHHLCKCLLNKQYYETQEVKNHRSGLSQGQQKGLQTGGDRIPRSSGPWTRDDPQVEEGLRPQPNQEGCHQER